MPTPTPSSGPDAQAALLAKAARYERLAERTEHNGALRAAFRRLAAEARERAASLRPPSSDDDGDATDRRPPEES